MKFVFPEKLYTDVEDEKKFSALLKQISRKKPAAGIFLITDPLSEAAIYEIYDMNVLLQPYYRKMKRSLMIHGISTSKKGARVVLADIVRERFTGDKREG